MLLFIYIHTRKNLLVECERIFLAFEFDHGMHKYSQQGGFYNGSMGPRISFSNDFADSSKQSINHENSYREAPVSSDFEFSISGNNLISADEVFFKGKLMPLTKEINSTKVVTLRDELLAGEEDDCHDIFNYRPLKNSGWWKEKLGLKKNQFEHPKKADQKNFGGLETIDEARKPLFASDMFTKVTGAN